MNCFFGCYCLIDIVSKIWFFFREHTRDLWSFWITFLQIKWIKVYMNIWGVRFSIEFEFNVFKALFIGRMHYPNLLSRAIETLSGQVWSGSEVSISWNGSARLWCTKPVWCPDLDFENMAENFSPTREFKRKDFGWKIKIQKTTR